MKNIFIIALAAVLILTAVACKAEKALESEGQAPADGQPAAGVGMTGGWTPAEDFSVTEERQAIFDKGMAALLGGSVIIETVFALPGIGKLTYDAISARDYTVVQSVVFLFALLVLTVNLLTDIIYSFLDPRVEF